MDLRGKRALVTGAGGFIGSHLVEGLVRHGCRVRAMLHYDSRAHRSNLELIDAEILKQIEIISGDVADPHFVFRAVEGCDAVFHLAALIAIPYSYVAPSAYVQANIVGTLNVLEACRIHGTPRMVHTSTSECYGTARYTPINEEHPLQGQSPYSASKIGADKIVESFHLSFGLPVATLRPFNTFGPRQSARAVIPCILAQLLSGRAKLHLGDLEPIRDMNYVANTVEGFIRIAECDAAIGQTINVGSGRGVRIGELVEMAMQLLGRRVPVETDANRQRPAKSEVWTLICDNKKAKELMGWTPRADLAAGLELTAKFVKDHLHLFRPEEYMV
jgi:UDP-glucose 4-epimerase